MAACAPLMARVAPQRVMCSATARRAFPFVRDRSPLRAKRLSIIRYIRIYGSARPPRPDPGIAATRHTARTAIRVHRSPTLGRRFVSTTPPPVGGSACKCSLRRPLPTVRLDQPRQSAAAKRRIRIERPPCAPKSLPPSRQLRPQTPKRPGTRIPTPGWRRGMLIATDDLPCMQGLITARSLFSFQVC